MSSRAYHQLLIIEVIINSPKPHDPGDANMKNMKTAFLTFSILSLPLLVSCFQPTPSPLPQEKTIAAQNTQISELQRSMNSYAPTPTGRRVPTETVYRALTNSPTPIPVEEVTKIIWSHKMDWVEKGQRLFLNEKQAAIQLADNRVTILDIINGGIIWTSSKPGTILNMDNEYIYLLASAQRVEAYETGSGNFKWQTFLSESYNELTKNPISNYYLFLYIPRFKTYILERETGNIVGVLPYQFVQTYPEFGIVSGQEDLIGLSERDWSEIWNLLPDNFSQKNRFEFFCPPYIIYKSEIGQIEALDVNTKTVVWNISSNESADIILHRFYPCYSYSTDYSFASPFIDPLSDNIYIDYRQSGATLLGAINKGQGEISWIGNRINAANTPENNYYDFKGEWGGIVIYSHSGFGVTEGYDATNHNLLWRNDNTTIKELIGPSDNNLIAKTNIKLSGYHAFFEVISIDKKTGEEVWRSSTLPFFYIKIINNKLVYTIRNDNQLYIVDANSGKMLEAIGLPEDEGKIIPLGLDHLLIQTKNFLTLVKTQ
jgi:hypothetical protein